VTLRRVESEHAESSASTPPSTSASSTALTSLLRSGLVNDVSGTCHSPLSGTGIHRRTTGSWIASRGFSPSQSRAAVATAWRHAA